MFKRWQRWRANAKQFPTQHPSMKWLSNANAWRAMDVALIMPALFLHIQRETRCVCVLGGRAAGSGVGTLKMKGGWMKSR